MVFVMVRGGRAMSKRVGTKYSFFELDMVSGQIALVRRYRPLV